MKQVSKINIVSIILVLAVLISVIFIVYPLVSEVKKEASEIIAQKNTLAELETKTKNLQEFQAKYQSYEVNINKIDALFVDSAQPVDFIEFLEKQASQSRLSINISPLPQELIEEDLWPSIKFQLTLTGSFTDFLKFFEKLELSPYLLEILDLKTRRLNEWDIRYEKFKGFSSGDVDISLLIKTFIK